MLNLRTAAKAAGTPTLQALEGLESGGGRRVGRLLKMFRIDLHLPIFSSAHLSVRAFLTPTSALLLSLSKTSSLPDNSFFLFRGLWESVGRARLLDYEVEGD